MQLATTIHRGWLKATQHHNPVVSTITRAAGRIRLVLGAESFNCSVCLYIGPFASFKGREKAKCPVCGSLERHRLQKLVMEALPERALFAGMSIIHFAPEPQLAPHFRSWFKSYVTADLEDPKVDYPKTDLAELPFPDESFDVLYASHVLEHVEDDRKALREIHRVLKPNGFAVVPVPIFCGISTVEYRHAVKTETDHWRQPGAMDYFNRHKNIFAEVRKFNSNQFDSSHQLYTLEDRSHWPTKDMPYRLPVPGFKHVDIVPVCYKAGPAGRKLKAGAELVPEREREAVPA